MCSTSQFQLNIISQFFLLKLFCVHLKNTTGQKHERVHERLELLFGFKRMC